MFCSLILSLSRSLSLSRTLFYLYSPYFTTILALSTFSLYKGRSRWVPLVVSLDDPLIYSFLFLFHLNRRSNRTS